MTYRDRLDALVESFDLRGTSTSGNYGHAGRPGFKGGSAPGKDGGAVETKAGTLRLKVRPATTDGPAFTGENTHGDRSIPDLGKQGGGNVGEQVLITVLNQAGKRASKLPLTPGQKAADIITNEALIEAKTGQFPRNKSDTWKWRITIGGDKTRPEGVTSKQWARVNRDKREAAVQRKYALLDRINKKRAGQGKPKLKAKSVFSVVNAKTRQIDFYEVDGYHKEVRFSHLRDVKAKHRGTFHFRNDNTDSELEDFEFEDDELNNVALSPEMLAEIAAYERELYDTLDRDVDAAIAWLDANDDRGPVTRTDAPYVSGFDLGGVGSGNFGHKGRPGEIGGSGEGDGDTEGGDDDPYALAPDAPRGGEGQGALFEYAPEAGSEGALRLEAEKAITTMDALLENAVRDADYSGVEAEEWDDMDHYDQNAVKAKWADQEKSNDYVEEAGQEAGREYLHDKLTADAIFENGMDEDFKEWLTNRGIDPESVTFTSGSDDQRLMETPELRIDQEQLRDVEGKPVGDGAKFDEVELMFGREMRAATRDVRADLEATDGYQEAVDDAENRVLRDEWSQMDDSQRMEIAKGFGMVPSNPVDHEAPGVWKFDGDMSDEDYVQTRAVALEMANARTTDLMVDRGLLPLGGGATEARALAEKTGESFWHAWKGSSTSPLGVAMQMVVAKEMGVHESAHITDEQRAMGRDAMVRQFTSADEQEHYNEKLGGFKTLETLAQGRAQAYVRAQWETTQFVMKQAGVETVDLYRGIILPKADVWNAREPNSDFVNQPHGTPLPNLKLLQNSVASTTTKPDVANTWAGVGDKTLSNPDNNRAVLRFRAPVSSVFSIPVFGENVHEESEVVLMGTKGIQWDAWAIKAPQFDAAPMLMPTPKGVVSIVEPEVKGLRVTWQLADDDKKKPAPPPPVLVDLGTNVDSHWLIDWRQHKERPAPKKRVIPSPAKRHSDALAQTIVRGMKKGMVPVMKKLTALEDQVAFLLGGEGSGNYGHTGRPGEVGGSGGGGTSKVDDRTYKKADGNTIKFLGEPPAALDPKKLHRVLGVTVEEAHALAVDMVQRLPGDVEVRVRTQHSDGHDRVTIKATTMDGMDLLQIFERRGDKLVNTLEFFALPTDYQGKDTAKHMMADTIKAYERIGVDRIELFANIDIGGYAWAKFGFVSDNPRKLAKEVTSRLTAPFPPPGRPSLTTLKPTETARVLKIIEDHTNDPKLPWHLANTFSGSEAVGKELLIGRKWYGSLDLHDKEQRGKFDAYVASEKPKES